MASRIADALVQRARAAVSTGERFDNIALTLSVDVSALEGALVASWRREFPKKAAESRQNRNVDTSRISWLSATGRGHEPVNRTMFDPTAEEQLHNAVKPAPPSDPGAAVARPNNKLASQPFARLTLAERAELDHALLQPDGQRNSADGHLNHLYHLGRDSDSAG